MTPATPPTPKAYRELIEHVRQTGLWHATAAALGWDQETMMPHGGQSVGFRADQIAQLVGLIHQRQTDRRIADWLASCEAEAALTADPASPAAVNLREIRRHYDRATRLPQALVVEYAQTTALARHHWAEARRNSDFSMFRPWLEKIVTLARQKAECWGWPDDGEPWDGLAEGYEPGMTAAQVAEKFAPLRHRLVELIGQINASATRPVDRLNPLRLPIERQRRFVRAVVERVGFDFSRGRLDESTHPFCSGFHRDDVRMTTRFHDDLLLDALSSTMHESGHGLYEQNQPDGAHIGTPFGSDAGLIVHESQSRLIENMLGRSRPFWRWCCGQLGRYFDGAAAALDAEACYASANVVTPGLIRVEADETTYNLHIMIRFELEREMMRSALAPADLPDAWNQRYKQALGLDVPDDARGCLQDIHWAMGAIGYFPTYTMGTMLAAQLYRQMHADLPDLDAHIERGDFTPLVGWLVDKVHSQGGRYRADALCRHVTGKALTAEPLLEYLEGKLRPLYGLQ